ncbi:MAG: aspartate--tRNA ligase [bacterium]|nr:MAG: aspartate--tRNA ligase [bacterium]
MLKNKRTHTCGELNRKHENLQVTLQGWVDRRRDHGSLIFIDLRDIHGRTQIVFDPSESDVASSKPKDLKPEYVISISGKVRLRPEGMVNKQLPTGEIEVVAEDYEVLNLSKTTPFLIVDDVDASEELRFKYRYLDLRRPEMQKSLIVRHRVAQLVRQYLDSQNFLEIETPFLMRSTPEGARDYLVPSRLHKGKFYALPQSPQTYKQILMIAGYDRYFQIVKCFRDEDLRAERQPEFTQIDMEMSFVDEQDVFRVVEGLMNHIFQQLLQITLPATYPIISYDIAMSKYGTDKPDLRFDLEIKDISSLVGDSEFKVFSQAVKDGGIVAGINLKGCAEYSRKQIDNLNQFVVELGGKGIITAKVISNNWESSIKKFMTERLVKKINQVMHGEDGDLLIFIAGNRFTALNLLGRLRLKLATDEGLINESEYRPVWITDFPLLEYDEEAGRYVAKHHPFTSPKNEDLDLMKTDPAGIRARAYDLVLNGYEIAGGSIRNHNYESQMKVFSLLKIDENEARQKFGFLLEALQYGAPPHGGIAFGLDRLVMILAGKKSIREIIPFPKTTSALSLMDNSPAEVDEEQLKELGLKISFQ